MFSSPERVELLTYVLDHPDAVLSVRMLAKTLKLSPGFVSVFLRKLKEENLIDKKANIPSPKVRALKVFLNTDKLLGIGLVKKVRQLMPGTSGIGIYGSWAAGFNSADSDLDLWIRAEGVDEENVLKLRAYLKDKLKVEPSVLIISDKRLAELKEKDTVFYCSLVNSFVLYGGAID